MKKLLFSILGLVLMSTTAEAVCTQAHLNTLMALNNAIVSANLGDVLCVDANIGTPVTITATTSMRLKNKTTGTGWITITAGDPTSFAQAALPADKVQMTPAYASSHALPTIITGTTNVPLIDVEAGAHHYWIEGFQFKAPTVSNGGSFIDFAHSGGAPLVQVDAPHHIIVSQVYAHGNDPSTGVKTHRFMEGDGNAIGLRHSYCDNFGNDGGQAQCFNANMRTGPFYIAGNFLQSQGEVVMFGADVVNGRDASTVADALDPHSAVIPGDTSWIHILANTMTMPPWANPYGTPNTFQAPLSQGYDVRNFIELKSGKNVLIEGNFFDGYDHANNKILWTGIGQAMAISTRGESFCQYMVLTNDGCPSTGWMTVTTTASSTGGAGGLIRLTTSTAHTVNTGDILIVRAIEGTTNANREIWPGWTATYISPTVVELQGSNWNAAWSGNGNGFNLIARPHGAFQGPNGSWQRFQTTNTVTMQHNIFAYTTTPFNIATSDGQPYHGGGGYMGDTGCPSACAFPQPPAIHDIVIFNNLAHHISDASPYTYHNLLLLAEGPDPSNAAMTNLTFNHNTSVYGDPDHGNAIRNFFEMGANSSLPIPKQINLVFTNNLARLGSGGIHTVDDGVGQPFDEYNLDTLNRQWSPWTMHHNAFLNNAAGGDCCPSVGSGLPTVAPNILNTVLTGTEASLFLNADYSVSGSSPAPLSNGAVGGSAIGVNVTLLNQYQDPMTNPNVLSASALRDLFDSGGGGTPPCTVTLGGGLKLGSGTTMKIIGVCP